jgi:hypothetical protein
MMEIFFKIEYKALVFIIHKRDIFMKESGKIT